MFIDGRPLVGGLFLWVMIVYKNICLCSSSVVNLLSNFAT